MDVASAADELGLSRERVRQLIGQGELEAERVGRMWMIDRDDVRRRGEVEPGRGRPFGPRQVWRIAMLASLLADSPSTKSVAGSAQERWRLRQYWNDLVQVDDPRQLAWRLRRRSDRPVAAYVHPSFLERLVGDERLVVSGVRAAAIAGADLVDDSHVDAYVALGDLDDVIADHDLLVDVDDGNVRLRPTDQLSVWRESSEVFAHRQHVAPLLLVIADLCDRDDARADVAAQGLWDGLRRELAGV